MMSMAAASCQKENLVEQQNTEADVTYKTVYYTVDGVTSQASFVSEESWQEFLDWIVTLAEEGHRVSFRNAKQERSLTKEVVTFTTNKHEEAVAWANQMEKAGYEVAVDYDPKTGIYTCVAIK